MPPGWPCEAASSLGLAGLLAARGDCDEQARERQQAAERDREEARSHVRELADAVADAGIDGRQADDHEQRAAVVILLEFGCGPKRVRGRIFTVRVH
jgi:hypothetical protein